MTHERAIYILKKTAWSGTENDLAEVEEAIKTLEDTEPVRRGRWVSAAGENVPFDENIKGDPYCPCDSVWCSECGAWLTASDEYFVTGRYCPNCGAKMEEEEL